MANVDVNRVAGNIGALNSLYSLRQVNQDLATRQASACCRPRTIRPA
ncbi:MAG TPA: hypothetical protein PK954_08265 [Anaerolineales bacterium]|nr:hypothetical protein [Anaerolineales bacterium]